MRRINQRHAPKSAKLDVPSLRAHFSVLIAEGRHTELLDTVIELISEIHQDNVALQLKLLSALRRSLGKSSEKISAEQLALLLDGIEVAQIAPPDATGNEGAPANTETTPDGAAPDAPAEKPKRNGGTRRAIPESIPRREINVPLDEAACTCAGCGKAKAVIGTERSEVLEWSPSAFELLVYLREKRACSVCRDGVVTAPAVDKVIDGARPGPGFLAQIIVAKFGEHQPFYRQAKTYERYGIQLSDSTLGEWCAGALDSLTSIANCIRDQIIESYLVGIDGSGLRVLDRDSPEGVRRGSMWAMVGSNDLAYFLYTPTGTRDGPRELLAKRTSGPIQCDGAQLFDFIDERGSLCCRIACMAHARRKFVEALDTGDRTGAIAVRWFRQLYDIERLATADGVDAAERLARRQRDALPILANIRDWSLRTRPTIPPRSPLGKALGYIERRWLMLVAYAFDGQIPIDNNRVERAIRGLALGRRNWLFAGSDDAATRTAIAYTLIASCALQGVEPCAYLRDVLARIAAGWPQSRLRDLLPDAFAKEQRQNAERDGRSGGFGLLPAR